MTDESTTEGHLSNAMADRLQARSIDPELAVRMGLWSKPGKGGGEVCVIPFYRNGKVENHKYRTSITPGEKGQIWQDKGAEKLLWNEDALRDDSLLGQPVIMTEGEFDALAAVQAGFLRTTSVPEGAPETPIGEQETSKYDFLDPVRDLLSMDRAPEIILAVDGDEAGGALLHDLSIRLGRARCKYLVYPRTKLNRGRPRCKDLNEVLEEYGERGVRETIERAQWLRLDGIYRMSELPPLPPAVAFECGFPLLCNHMRLRLGDFTVVTGIPSHGKTSFVNDLVCRVVEKYGVNASFASFEQSPQRDHKRNLRTWFSRKLIVNQTDAELQAADDWIDRYFSFIAPNEDDDVTLDWVLDRAEAAVVRYGARIVVIDPWNEMDHARNRGESLTEYVGRAIKAFKRFARKLQVHLIIVAHPAKQVKKEDGTFAVPTLYDISDSAHWYNKADLGVVVHRTMDEDDNGNLVLGPTLIRVSKSRYHDEIGTPGDVKADFLPECRRYSIIEQEAKG